MRLFPCVSGSQSITGLAARVVVCSLVTVLFCLLLSGCVASNAVLRHANDIEQTLYWVPEVHTVQREASGWRLSGDSTLRPLDAARPPAAPWQLCIPARAPTNVTITMTSLAAYHCAEPVSASATPATPGNALRIPYHSGPVSGSTAIAAGDYLAFRSSHPAAGMPPSRALFHVASPTPAWVDVVHFEGHTQAETIKQGNRLYLALMPVAVVIDIVSTPVILTRYALHVRRQNKTSP